MARGVVEHSVRTGLFGGRRRFRVDLHGVSVFGPRDEHVLIRWEWVERVSAGVDVVVASAGDEVSFPAGAFGLAPTDLAERLERARSIVHRSDVIAELGGSDV